MTLQLVYHPTQLNIRTDLVAFELWFRAVVPSCVLSDVLGSEYQVYVGDMWYYGVAIIRTT